ncbi:hypothetical protein [Planktomarina sp.]|uniref:hypothetical protein n=1 Tax=Planktomarina sp. TaxID=2024851 RepID=UPI0032616E44
MAYKMKNGTGPNALPLLALIPPAIAAAKGLIGAGVVAGGAKAAAAGAAIAKAAGTVGGAVGGAAKAVGGGIAGAAGKVGGAVGGAAGKAAGKVGGAAGKVGAEVGKAAGKEGFKALVKDAGKGTLISTLAQAPVTAKQKIEENQALKQQEQALFKSKFSPSMMGDVKGPNMEKSRKRVAQDYARNAIADRKAGRTREANYEQKEATRVAAGEAPSMMGHNPISKHMGGRGASMYGGPMMKGENVIVRDAKSGGKNQYNKRGK